MMQWLANAVQELLDFSNVLNASICAGWLVLAILILRLLLKRSPKWVHVALWGIVALRLLMPFSIESPLSLIPSSQTVSKEVLQAGPVPGAEPAYLQVVTNPSLGGTVSVELDTSISSFQWSLVEWNLIWFAGMAVMAAYTLLSYLSLRRRLRTAVLLRENIWQCEAVHSPFVLGLVKPKIYLPFGMADPYVIAHERAHIRRRDHWWKPLGFLLLTVHWFNPLIWLAYILLCRDIELACDEKVIAQLGNAQRADYSQALVACSVRRFRIAACPLAFGEVGVKERVKSIMNYRKPTFWIMVAAAAVCVTAAVCFLTDPKPVPEFAMGGSNVSDLDPEEILRRIVRFQQIENSDVYTNADNFSLTLDGDFHWPHEQMIRYFFYDNHKTRCAQLRMFPEEQEFYLTESRQWPEQDRIFLLRHYLDALKYLPQEAIREQAPADQYGIELVDGGTPSDYERVITYSSQGVGETEGWYLHLCILPRHANGDAYSGTGEEVLHLFYGDKAAEGAVQWFDYSKTPQLLDWNAERSYTAGEFPGMVFRCDPYRITAGDQVILQGMPIWSVYLSDLNGDGYPEICAETSWGSGLIDNRVVIYDYQNSMSYLVEDRGNYDYYLRRDSSDGQLYLEKRIANSDVVVSSGRLRIEDGAVRQQSGPVYVLMAKLLSIEDGHFIVEPVEGSPERSSASRIMVPMEHMEPSPEPVIGDILQIEYDGRLQEVYPARITNVYRISVAELAADGEMIPTQTEGKGLCAGALLLPLDGNTYRYLLTEHMPEGVTAGALLYTFQEVDMGEHIAHEVYALEEYPDKRTVLLISEKNGPWLCQYSPPRRCADTALTDAAEAGFVVLEDGLAAHGQEIWHEFYEQAQNGQEASVTVAHYYTLNPDQCDSVFYEIFRQDYPCLYVHELRYDGEQYLLTMPEGETKTYEYLMKYEDGPNDTFGSVVPQYRYRYVLTQDYRYTYEQLWMSVASSQTGAYIEHYNIYSEPKTE